MLEIHGSIHYPQCLSGCGLGVIPADHVTVQIDPVSMRARDPLPRCPRCDSVLRPNILMFGDGGWDSRRSDEQDHLKDAWLAGLIKRRSRLVIIECGAGLAISSVRRLCATVALRTGAPLIRINPRESEPDFGGYHHLSIPLGAQAALQAIGAGLAKTAGLPEQVAVFLPISRRAMAEPLRGIRTGSLPIPTRAGDGTAIPDQSTAPMMALPCTLAPMGPPSS